MTIPTWLKASMCLAIFIAAIGFEQMQFDEFNSAGQKPITGLSEAERMAFYEIFQADQELEDKQELDGDDLKR